MLTDKIVMHLREKKITLQPRPYLLKNKIQHYAWGTRGKHAFIPKLLGEQGSGDTPYAELWMGTHPNAPSEVFLNGSYVPLGKLISQYPVEILGKEIKKKFSGKLPFLFKVLSAGEALSIQAHPDKKQAVLLHAKDADHYPDDNHKPEIAIALTSLIALVGFKPFPEIRQNLRNYPEISNFIGTNIIEKFEDIKQPSAQEVRYLVKLMYSSLMNKSITDNEKLTRAIEQLENRLEKSNRFIKEEEKLFLDLKGKYGIDAGLFSIFLLNLIHLEEGQGIFLAAGVPHAYLKGNIVECMANSDNVVRAGLTSKFKDIKTLVKILTYDTNPVSILKLNSDKYQTIYNIPVQEFQVSRYKISADQKIIEKSKNRPNVLLIIDGNISISWDSEMESMQENFYKGQAIFIPAILDEFRIKSLSPVTMFKVDIP